MVELFKEFEEVCVDKITATEGNELQISAYLTDPDQIDLIMEGFLYSEAGLKSKYVPKRNELYLRITKSFDGKLCNDIVKIGQAPRMHNAGFGGFFGNDNE